MAELALWTAQLCSLSGMGWLALARREHWRQVKGPVELHAKGRGSLRALGAGALAAALLLSLSADHASMAVLVWVMSLSASALLIAFTLAWRPRWLVCLVFWVRDAPVPRDSASS